MKLLLTILLASVVSSSGQQNGTLRKQMRFMRREVRKHNNDDSNFVEVVADGSTFVQPGAPHNDREVDALDEDKNDDKATADPSRNVEAYLILS